MFELTIRPIDVWPDGWRHVRWDRKPNPFRAGYAETLRILEFELEALRSRSAHIQVDVAPGQIRRDGHLYAKAVVGHPGVILTVDSRDHGVLTYPCDTFAGQWSEDPPDWQINLRAIALGLEALRKVDRYGIAERGQQYAGFGALPPGGPIALGAELTPEQAARFIAEQAGWQSDDVDDLLDSSALLTEAFRAAAKRLHPDAGGDPALMVHLNKAKARLDAHATAQGQL